MYMGLNEYAATRTVHEQPNETWVPSKEVENRVSKESLDEVVNDIFASPEKYRGLLLRYMKSAGLNTMDDLLIDPPDRPSKLQPLQEFLVSTVPLVSSNSKAWTGRDLDTMALLDMEIKLRRNELKQYPLHHPLYCSMIQELGRLLATRFRFQGKLASVEDVDEAINLFSEVIRLLPGDSPNQWVVTSCLALAHALRYGRLQELSDLAEIIQHYSHLLTLLPLSDDARRAEAYFALASAMELHSERSGDDPDLNLITQYYRQGLLLVPCSNHNILDYHIKLALTLEKKIQKSELHSDREELTELLVKALAISREALSRMSPEDLGYSERLGDIVTVLRMQYRQSENLADLDEVISHRQAMLLLLPPTAPLSQRVEDTHRISCCFFLRFTHSGELFAADEALTYQRETVELARSGHLDSLPEMLSRLSIFHKFRFERSGDSNDMDKAIEYHRESVQPQLIGKHKNRVSSLSCLANILCTRFELYRDQSDLKEALHHSLLAASLTSPGNDDYGTVMTQLASTICRPLEFALTAEELPTSFSATLGLSLKIMEDAVNSYDHWDPRRNPTLTNLFAVVRTRGRLLESLEDMNRAVEISREVLCLSDNQISSQSESLYNLACTLLDRFKLGEDISDLDEAIFSFRKAQDRLPFDHSFQGNISFALGNAYSERNALLQDVLDLDEAFANLERTANQETSGSRIRFNAACNWVSDARKRFHHSTLRAYSTALSLVTRYVTMSHTIETQHSQLIEVPQALALNATSWAISEGQLETAIELLEQGRTVLWSQVGRYRTPLDRLKIVNPALAIEFRRLSTRLERDVVSCATTSVGDASGYRSLSSQWSKMVEKIRALGGFSDFLKSTPFATLQSAAAKGPVIVINVDIFRSDALIVQYTGSPVLVPLYRATPRVIATLSSEMDAALKMTGDSDKMKSFEVIGILRRLWDLVVRPIVDQLKATCGLPDGSRIWWCPTSSLWSLPLHAAGPYKKGKRNMPDIYISSYTPTLSSLLQPLKRKAEDAGCVPPSLLVAVQAETPGQMPLPNVVEEVKQVKAHAPSVNLLDGEHATHDAVLSGLEQCSWVHLACHGHQDPIHPFNSSFTLHDRRLPLLDIIQTELKNAELAFLSACHSAAGDRSNPNEVIHLAAGLQFSGFGGVVGTMWAMADIDGPVVAGEFYKHMFRRSDGVADYQDAAAALNLATRELRRRKVPVERWINFIHVGA